MRINKMESTLPVNKENRTTEKAETTLSMSCNHANVDYPRDKCIHDLFEEQARKTPDNVAVVMGDQKLTYKQLEEKSNQLAHYLAAKGVGPETLVGICLDRSLDIIIAILSILKAGGAYVPIDPFYPKDRISYMFNDSGCPVLISHSSFQKILSETSSQIIYYDKQLPEISKAPVTRLESGAAPHNLAYVIYTSGSTGNPKGVLIEHRNVVRLLFNDRFQFDFSERDVWTIFHSFCFDFSVWEMYGALLYGGTAVIIPKESAREAFAFAQTIRDQKVTVINQTPSAFYNLIPKMLEFSSSDIAVRYVILGGEKLNPIKLNKIKQAFPKIKFINMYGITETTVHVTYKEITLQDIDAGFSNIGNPIPTLNTYIFDENMKLTPIGVEGELCVGGDGVSRGYLNCRELTSEKFVQNPYNPEERIYRSGDLACMQENGDLEYFGRMDTQVQLRGFRIELGEIESAIAKIEEIEDCVVIAHEDSNQDKRLIAYVIFNGEEITADKIREQISKSLPEYMIPSFFIKIDQIPLTSNGKLDDKKLPEPDIETVSTVDYAAPTNDTEQALVEIWEEVLGLESDNIGIEQNFFEIGGHSLGAAAVVQHIRKAFNKTITIRYIFENPTIAELARVIPQLEDLKGSNASKSVTATPKAKTYPLLNGQIISWLCKCLLKNKTSNVCGIYTLDGILDFKLLQRAVEAVSRQHDTIWHSFSKKRPTLLIGQPQKAQIEFIDASTQPGNDHDVLSDELLDRVLHSEFDLSRSPLFRLAVVKQGENKHFLLISFPHIICDYASLSAFVTEVFEAYRANGETPGNTDPKTTALEMVNIEKRTMQTEEFTQGYYYWKDKLRNPNFPILGKEFFLTPGKHRPNQILTKIHLSDETINGLQKVANQNKASIQIAVLALLKATMYSFSGHKDISVSMIMDARGIHPNPPVMNLNVGNIIVRSNFSRYQTYQELLEHVKWYVIDAHNHFRFPIIAGVPMQSMLKDKPLAAAMVKFYRAALMWRYKKAMVDKEVITRLLSINIGKRALAKEVGKKNKDMVLAPDIFYNVLPNFYEDRVVYSSDALKVFDLREREKIINHRVFEENSDYFDAISLNCELIRGEDDEAYVYLWGGGYTKEALERIRHHFLKHLSAFLDSPNTPFNN